MFTKKQTLVAKFAAKDESRPEIAGVFVAHDRMAATDSYTLAEVKITEPIDPNDFPLIQNNAAAMKLPAPLILPKDFIEKLGAAIPDGKNLPILGHAAYTGSAQATDKGAGSATFTTTDLETATNHTTRTIEGTFPKYELLLPDTAAVAKINLNADYLLKAAKLFSDFYKKTGGRLPIVTLEIRECNEPIVMRASAMNHDATVLIMPIRQ